MKTALGVSALLLAALAGAATQVVRDQCGPFIDVSPMYCPYVLEMYYLGITAGTSPTTFSPDNPVTRGQAAVFVSKSVNQALARSSQRAALGQWWTSQGAQANFTIPLTGSPQQVRSDGSDLWVANILDNTVTRIGRDGRSLGTWTGATSPYGVLIAMGRIFVTGNTLLGGQPGKLYMIDPTQPPGDVSVVASNLGSSPQGIAFDGSRIWTANEDGSISIVTPGGSPPWPVTTVTTGTSSHESILFDGTNMWLDDGDTLLRLDPTGSILQTITLDGHAGFHLFDGENVWVVAGNSIDVVSSASGAIVANLTGNGLNAPGEIAFDGQRILVTNGNMGASTVSLWRAADLTPLGSVFVTPGFLVKGACSDGVDFWLTFDGPPGIQRF